MTRAAQTAFALRRVQVGMYHFLLDGNSKVTAWDGTPDDPAANAFSLRAVDDCPHSTAACRQSCYVQNLRRLHPAIYAAYEHNSEQLRTMLSGPDPIEPLAEAFAAHIRHLKSFRWHVSGDIISPTHALWIKRVCETAPDTQCWIYTRSHQWADLLSDVQNLALNLSADRDNWVSALVTHHRIGARICYMAQDDDLPPLPDGSVIFPDYGNRNREWFERLQPRERRMVCPVDTFRASRCGPCKKCMK